MNSSSYEYRNMSARRRAQFLPIGMPTICWKNSPPPPEYHENVVDMVPPPRSSKSCGCETFRVLKYLLSIFLHYTHHCRMILSKKMCCLLLNGVSTESQKRTSVLQIRRDFSPTRHMTRINVGLALSLVKLLLSSWKIYMCNLVTWYTNK